MQQCHLIHSMQTFDLQILQVFRDTVILSFVKFPLNVHWSKIESKNAGAHTKNDDTTAKKRNPKFQKIGTLAKRCGFVTKRERIAKSKSNCRSRVARFFLLLVTFLLEFLIQERIKVGIQGVWAHRWQKVCLWPWMTSITDWRQYLGWVNARGWWRAGRLIIAWRRTLCVSTPRSVFAPSSGPSCPRGKKIATGYLGL